MKASVRFATALALVVRAAATASEAGEGRSTLAFEGVMATGSDMAFALSVPGERAVRWLRLGETFAAHRLEAFDAPAETLVLRRDGREVRLALKSARIVDGVDDTVRQARAAQARVRENLRYLAVAAEHFFAATGRERAGFADLVGPEKAIEVLRAVAGEDYAGLEVRRGAARLALALPDGGNVEIELGRTHADDGAYRLARAGESVEQIAAAGGAPMERVLELNELAEGGAVRAGRLLRLK